MNCGGNGSPDEQSILKIVQRIVYDFPSGVNSDQLQSRDKCLPKFSSDGSIREVRSIVDLLDAALCSMQRNLTRF